MLPRTQWNQFNISQQMVHTSIVRKWRKIGPAKYIYIYVRVHVLKKPLARTHRAFSEAVRALADWKTVPACIYLYLFRSHDPSGRPDEGTVEILEHLPIASVWGNNSSAKPPTLPHPWIPSLGSNHPTLSNQWWGWMTLITYLGVSHCAKPMEG